MRRFLLAAALAAMFVPDADAGWRSRSRTRAVAVTRTVSTAGGTATTAQSKSEAQAATGRMAHVGPVPAGHVEGVGYSSVSAADALGRCCFSNSGLPLIEQAVVRGERGWFATRIFAASRTVCVNGNCR